MTPKPTPRTDAAQLPDGEYRGNLVWAGFARQLERELAETAKDYQCLAELLDGHDATECRGNLVKLKRELAEKAESLAFQTQLNREVIEREKKTFAELEQERQDRKQADIDARAELATARRALEWARGELGKHTRPSPIDKALGETESLNKQTETP